MEALESFNAALQIDLDFVEAYFNAALALHQMDRFEEATRSCHRAGELALRNEVNVNSALYRSHSALSSPLGRLLSGGILISLDGWLKVRKFEKAPDVEV